MKTIFLQQIIAIALFSLSTTSTFATPLPPSGVTGPNAHTTNVETHASTPGHGVERPGEVRTLGTIMGTIQASIDGITAPTEEIGEKFKALEKKIPQKDDDTAPTLEFLQSTLRAHHLRTQLGKNLKNMDAILIRAMQFSVENLVALLKLPISEEKGTPLINSLIKMVEDLAIKDLDNMEDKSRDDSYCQFLLGQINVIMNLKLGWEVIPSLREAKSTLDTKVKAHGSGRSTSTLPSTSTYNPFRRYRLLRSLNPGGTSSQA